MTDDKLLPFDLPAVRRKKLTVDFDGGNQSSNGGLLLLRHSERKLGVCGRHEMFEMVMARVSAIACGHKDGIDLDRPRHDPLMKVAVGRCPESGAPLASQSTISRLENAEQNGGGAAHRSSRRSGRHDSEALQAGDPRHRRHVLRGTWWSAAGVLERASRRAASRGLPVSSTRW
jgi:Transposase DDE domain group 1